MIDIILSDTLTDMTASPELLQAALEGLEAKLAKINAMIIEIKGIIRSNQTSVPGPSAAKRTKRNLSPESRKRMAEAQRRRWAKQQAEA